MDPKRQLGRSGLVVLMNRVLVKYGEGLDSLWRSKVDRTVLQCYCSTKTRGNPSKRTNHGNLAGGIFT